MNGVDGAIGSLAKETIKLSTCCISYRDLDIRGDTVKIQTDVIACCCMSTVLIVSNSTAKTWFVGFPSLVSLRSPKYWPEPAPGRFGVGDSVKVKPKPPPLLELEGTKVKTKEVLNEVAAMVKQPHRFAVERCSSDA
ncbi:hypothetical protein DY000_02027651 [Brassica cretica]|uniref:Uncharacterized protein n=1 Tax=Brassica cretica TaxID=69181 RepID=A0ABQ7EL88_BRACR|nr:hypothetical protein DY000_02027651 [Brassica cretica]